MSYLANYHRVNPDFGVADAVVQNPTTTEAAVVARVGGLCNQFTPFPANGPSYAKLQYAALLAGAGAILQPGWPALTSVPDMPAFMCTPAVIGFHVSDW